MTAAERFALFSKQTFLLSFAGGLLRAPEYGNLREARAHRADPRRTITRSPLPQLPIGILASAFGHAVPDLRPTYKQDQSRSM